MFTLNSMSDDYENLTVSIMPSVNRDAAVGGMTIEKPEVVHALQELVELGWAKAWQCTGTEITEEFDHIPSLEEMEGEEPGGFSGAWFYITEAGRKVQNEYDAWPFDEQGEMRKDWTPPEN